jgi:hypothetical protein
LHRVTRTFQRIFIVGMLALGLNMAYVARRGIYSMRLPTISDHLRHPRTAEHVGKGVTHIRNVDHHDADRTAPRFSMPIPA